MPRIETRLLYHDHVDGRGVDLFAAIKGKDLEGIVREIGSAAATHCDGHTTSWLKIRNSDYSQMEGRHDVFAPRRSVWSRSRSARPVLCPELQALGQPF